MSTQTESISASQEQVEMILNLILFVIIKTSNSKKEKLKFEMNTKLNWSEQEEQFLRKIVQSKKDLTWNQIAIQMNKEFPEKIRTGKQYRERYVNYVQYEQNNKKNNSWTEGQQKLLFKSYRQMGTKWTIIAKIIPSKSENSLKNKFYGALRKTLRKINRIGKQKIKKFNKLIRYQSLIRIMDAAQGGQDLPNDIKINSIEIKQKILQMAQKCQGQFIFEKVSEIIKQIHKFNIATRCYSSKKWKRSHFSQKEVKVEQSDQYSMSEEKTLKQSVKTKKSNKSRSQGNQFLQQNRRFNKENMEIKVYKQQTGSMDLVKQQQPIQGMVIDLLKSQKNLEQGEAQSLSYHEANNDLQYELCGILHQNYIPQYFDYFEE